MEKLINLISPFVTNCFDNANQLNFGNKYLIFKKGYGREAGLMCLMWCGKYIGCSDSDSDSDSDFDSDSDNKLYLFEYNNLNLLNKRDKCTYVFYELNNLYGINDIIQFIKTNCICTTRTHKMISSDFFLTNTTLIMFYNTISYGGDGYIVTC